jgi:DNA-binding CsgD family transcriptional regulator
MPSFGRTVTVATHSNVANEVDDFPCRLLGTILPLAGASSAFLVLGRSPANAYVVNEGSSRRQDADLTALLGNVAMGVVGRPEQLNCYLGSQLPFGGREPFASLGVDVRAGSEFRMLAILAESERVLGVLGLGRRAGQSPFSEADLNRLDGLRSVIALAVVEHLRAVAAERKESEWRAPAQRGSGPASAPSMRISRREREVGELLADGYSALNIAALTGLSEGTVRTYVRRLYRKLGVCSRVAMVRAMQIAVKCDSPSPSQRSNERCNVVAR